MDQCSGWLTEHFDIVCCICLPNRRAHMEEFFTKMECAPLWINPVMKDTISTSDSSIVVNNANLGKGRIACHLSHIKALRTLLEEPFAQTILVFEDDLRMPSSKQLRTMRTALKEGMNEIPSTWEAFYLGKCWEACFFNQNVGTWVTRTRSAMCRHALAFSRTGAQKVIQNTLPMRMAGDRMIESMLQEGTLEGYSMRRPLFHQNRSKWGSTLGNYDMLYICREEGYTMIALHVLLRVLLIILIVRAVSKLLRKGKVTPAKV